MSTRTVWLMCYDSNYNKDRDYVDVYSDKATCVQAAALAIADTLDKGPDFPELMSGIYEDLCYPLQSDGASPRVRVVEEKVL